MKMYTLFFTAVALLCFNGISAQQFTAKGWTVHDPNAADTTTLKLNSTYLLLGTLNDYTGRNRAAKPNLVDWYFPYEIPLMQFVDSLVRTDFKVTLTEKDNAYFSAEFSKKMNSFYDGAELKDSLLYASAQNKLSFLTGVYYRNGAKVSDDIYKIHLSNSPKNVECYEIVKQLKCKDIYFKRLDNIPVQYILYFRATGPVKKYFAAIEAAKEKLTAAYMEKFYKKTSVIDHEKLYKEYTAKENQKIIDFFK